MKKLVELLTGVMGLVLLCMPAFAQNKIYLSQNQLNQITLPQKLSKIVETLSVDKKLESIVRR